MSTATVGTDEKQHQEKQCRLCSENIIASEIQCAIDILNNVDVRRLLEEVYELRVHSTDNSTTVLCWSCYLQLVQDYKFRMKLFALRKSFKLNQTMLVTQIIAFKDTADKLAKLKPDGNRFVSVRETCTQTETPEPPERSSSVTAEPQANGHDESNVEQQPQSTDATTTTTIMERQLVPLVVDCLKEPRYLKALQPLVVSTDPGNPEPLMLLCSRCYKTFKSKEKLKHHKSVGCLRSCRYCRAEQTVSHSCTYQREYSDLMQHTVGSEKYVTTYAAFEIDDNMSLLRSLLGSDDEQDEASDPKAKKMKLDANHNGREFSSDRRSATPQSCKADKNGKIPEIRSEPVKTPAASMDAPAPVITVLSSDDDSEKLELVDPTKPAAKERPKIKARRKSVRIR